MHTYRPQIQLYIFKIAVHFIRFSDRDTVGFQCSDSLFKTSDLVFKLLAVLLEFVVLDVRWLELMFKVLHRMYLHHPLGNIDDEVVIEAILLRFSPCSCIYAMLPC